MSNVNQILEVIWDDKLIDELTKMVMEHQRKESTSLKLLNENLREVKNSISNILKKVYSQIQQKNALTNLKNKEKNSKVRFQKRKSSIRCLNRTI